MPTGLISRRSVDALAPGTKDFVLWDSRLAGFGLKVTPAGTKVYIFRYRPPGGQNKRTAAPRKVTLGRHGALTPEQARAAATALAAQVSQGVDPIEAEKRAEADRLAREAAEERAAAEAVSLRIDTLSVKFLDHLKAQRPRSHDSCEGVLRLHILPVVGSLRIDQITRSDANRVLNRIDSSKVALRRITFATLSWLSSWATDAMDLPANPMAGLKAPPSAAARDRVLGDDELRWIWFASETLPSPYPGFYQLLILTAQRRDEVAGLDWNELSRERAEWTLPSERSKNAEANIVPLSSAVVALLDGIAGSAKWPRSGPVIRSSVGTPLTAFSKGKKLLDAAIAKLAAGESAGSIHVEDAALPGWRVHDIRRTVATGLQRLGTRFEVTEAILNHRSGSRSGVAGIYQRYGWGEEKRAALEAWARHVAALIENSHD